MSELDHDPEFEAYLARRAGWRGKFFQRDELEPPRDLDRIVLAKAREAIEMPPQLPLYAGARWALPVALAATVLLSFAIIVHMGALPRSARQSAPATSPLRVTAERRPLEELQAAPAPRESADRISADESRAEPVSALAKSERRAKAAAPPLAQAQRAPAAVAPPDALPTPAPAPAPTAVPEPAAVVAGSRKEDSTAAANTAAQTPDPAAWLRRIEQLRAQGKLADAERELQAFRKAWPHYPLPEDLNR